MARLRPSDGVHSASFGMSVAVNGDTLIVGSPFSASAYIYDRHRGGPNAWGEVAKLTASDAAPGTTSSYFGYSVAITGETAVVGATGTWGGVHLRP